MLRKCGLAIMDEKVNVAWELGKVARLREWEAVDSCSISGVVFPASIV